MIETQGPEERHPTRERGELVATKLAIPRVRPGSLVRSRLHRALDEATAKELTLVCTPAGFGKTTLLAGWAREGRMPVAWLSLDPDDSDPVRFWRYVVAALGHAGIDVGEAMLPFITPPNVPSSRGIVSALINRLEALQGDVTLILDDYNMLGSEAIHDGVGFLVEHLPAQLHLVIASRSDPPLPIGRLRARGQLTELRAAHLRFTSEEAAEFLRDVWSLHLSPEAVAAVEARAEGWAVGLQLAALSLSERVDAEAFVAEFTGTHRYILDYLSAEVLERQSDAVRRFLLQTSILERLNGGLCDALTGGRDGQAMLEELERANLFLVPLDDTRRWYRFHRLFGELLRARLQSADAELVPELNRRAAAWFEQHGLVDEAIRHASASGDAPWASHLVEEHLDETLRRGEEVVLARWLGMLPDAAVRAAPALCLAKGLMEFHRGRLGSVEQLLEEADSAKHQARDRMTAGVPTTGGMVAEIPAATALLRAELAAARGQSDAIAEHASAALALTTEAEIGPRFWGRWLLAFSEWNGGRLDEAERAFAELLVEGRSTPQLNAVMSTGSTLARVQLARGKLGAALRTYREGLRFLTDSGRLSVSHAGELHVGIAGVLCERNDLDAAFEHVSEGIDLCRHAMVLRERDRGLATLAWIHQAQGKSEGALEAMDEACRMYPSPEATSLFNPAPAERARLWLVQGRIDQASRWIEERGVTDEDPIAYPHELDHLVMARMLLARSEPARASRLLEQLDALAEAQGRFGSLVGIRALRSLALQGTGDRQAALEMLGDALSLARPEGYVRIFVDEGPPMAALIQRLVRSRQQPGGATTLSHAVREHAMRVVGAFRASAGLSDEAVTPSTSVEPLTPREIEVLELLAAGRPNQQIADELVVTLDTVKRHVSHIFAKLGVRNRTEAVARARDHHLVG